MSYFWLYIYVFLLTPEKKNVDTRLGPSRPNKKQNNKILSASVLAYNETTWNAIFLVIKKQT